MHKRLMPSLAFIALLMGCFLLNALPASRVLAADAAQKGYKIAKVNTEFVDAQGYTTEVIGDLKAKALYQRQLERSGKYSAIRYNILWQAPSTPTPDLTVKLEARGLDGKSGRETIETLTKTYPHKSHFSGWAVLDIQGDALKNFGKPRAWKITILQDNHPMAERKSFTWDGTGRVSEEPAAHESAPSSSEPAATESTE
jgi:hypothetical protein